jgi:multidrug efflux pump
VVFGLGIATVLTLVVTPSLLSIRVWLSTYMSWMGRLLARLTGGRSSRIAQDMRLAKKARKLPTTELLWDELTGSEAEAKWNAKPDGTTPLRAAE